MQDPRLPPVERDAFWDTRQAPRYPRWSEQRFWANRGRVRVPSVEEVTTRSHAGFALWATLIGLLGILSFQYIPLPPAPIPMVLGHIVTGAFLLDLFRLLAVFAPIFEELFKFGLALLLVSWAPRTVLPWIGIVAGWAVGGTFGFLEHNLYSEESDYEYILRVLFHGFAAGLSVAMYSWVSASPRRRILWFTTALSSIGHWLVNGFAVPLGLVGNAMDSDLVPDAWMSAVVAALLLVTLLAAAVGPRLRATLEQRVP